MPLPGRDLGAAALVNMTSLDGPPVHGVAVNGDGIDDLVASTPENGRVYGFRSQGAAPDGSGVAFASPTLTYAPGFGASFAALFGSVRQIF